MSQSDPYRLPDGHRPFDGESHQMSLDSNNNLYWRGERLKLEASIPSEIRTFGFWVGVFAILASLSAVGGFLIQATAFFGGGAEQKIDFELLCAAIKCENPSALTEGTQ